MDFLIHNPIADLRGPSFLVFYLFLTASAIGWTLWRKSRLDATTADSAPALPTEFDPFEISYLRGSSAELVRLVLLDLIARGYLVHSVSPAGADTIGQNPQPPALQYLDTTQRQIFNSMGSHKEAKAIVEGVFTQRIGEDHRADLEQRGLLSDAKTRSAMWRAARSAVALIAGIGFYKLLVALSREHFNVWFLIVLLIVAVVALIWAGRPPRLTRRGREYLRKLQDSLADLRGQIPALAGSQNPDHLLLATSVFGISALAGTSYAYYPTMFQKAAQQPNDGGAASGSSCGSASSSDGGSSCSGGCGGGGCGGCGS